MKALEIKVGDKFNNYTVISKPYKNRHGYRVVKCKCQCGKEREQHCGSIKRLTQCKSCDGKSYRKYKSNDKIGKLTVIDYLPYNKSTDHSEIKVRCECGNEYTTSAYTLSEIQQCRKCFSPNFGSDHHSYRGTEHVSKTYYSQIQLGAIKRNLEFNITIKDIDKLIIEQDFKCALTDLDITIGNELIETTASLDRIDSSIGYVINNVQWLHKDVNLMKQNLSEKRLQELSRLIYEKQLRLS